MTANECDDNIKFIIFSLNDTAFKHQLYGAISDISEYNLMTEQPCSGLKNSVIKHIIGKEIASDSLNIKSETINWNTYKEKEQYLSKNLTVTLSKSKPSETHQGGSSYYDIALSQVVKF